MKLPRLSLLAKLILALSLLILAFLLFELLFRPGVIRHALASASYNRGNYRKAEKTWSGLRDPKDSDPIPENSLGKAQFRNGKYDESINSQEDALKEQDKVAQFHYDRGNALYRGKKLDEALKEYRSAMLLDPDDQDAKSNYELVLKRQGYKPPPPEPSPEKQEDEEQRPAPKPPSEEDQEQYRNLLDALDQQEARNRQQKGHPSPKGSDKWW